MRYTLNANNILAFWGINIDVKRLSKHDSMNTNTTTNKIDITPIKPKPPILGGFGLIIYCTEINSTSNISVDPGDMS